MAQAFLKLGPSNWFGGSVCFAVLCILTGLEDETAFLRQASANFSQAQSISEGAAAKAISFVLAEAQSFIPAPGAKHFKTSVLQTQWLLWKFIAVRMCGSAGCSWTFASGGHFGVGKWEPYGRQDQEFSTYPLAALKLNNLVRDQTQT